MDASGSVEPLGMEWAGCMHEAERRPVNLARQLPADGRAAFEIGGHMDAWQPDLQRFLAFKVSVERISSRPGLPRGW